MSGGILYPYMQRFIIIILFFISTQTIEAQTARSVIDEMIKSTNRLKGFTSIIDKTERIKGELITQVSAVKVSRFPYQVYVKQLYPKEGIEILCADGCRKALINPNGFPWINLTLDPYGVLMRKKQHHTVHDSGFDLLVEILSAEVKERDQSTVNLELKPDVIYEGIKAYRIEMSNSSYRYINYTVKGNEDITQIAKKLHVNEYAILEHNKDCSDYEDVKDGQVIKVPSNYARRMTLFVNKSNKMPLLIRVFDDKGLFEEYIYRDLVLNPEFAKNEFSENFHDYNF